MMPSITNLPPMSNAAKGSLRELSTLVKYLSPYRWQIAGAILALLATSVSVLGMGAALRYLVDFGLSRGNAELLDRAYWQMMGVVVVLAAASYARFLLVAWLGERVVADVRRDVYARLVSLHIGFFETAKTGEILSRLTTDTSLLQTIIGGSIAVALRNIIMLTGGCIMLLHTSPKLTLYVFAIVPLVVVPIIIFGRRVRRHSRDSQDKVAALSAHGEETLSGIRTVQAFTLEHTERAQFERRLQDVLRTGLARIQAKAILTSIVISLVFGAIITVLWIGGRDVLAGRISGGELSAFVFYAAIVAGAVGALSEVMGDVQRAAGAAERIGELLALEPTIASPANPVPLPAGGLDIRFEHATFTYPARPNTPSISDMELSIQSGEMVALVGPSGAGKTTLFSLLLRFYDPQSGSIRLGGIDLRQLDLQQLRRAIGIVPQEPVIFSTDAMENIRCGRPEATDAEVIEAARAAAALDFLTALPQGLHTYLGEKGVQLSGGQKQRIAIARAIIRDPKILLLDEATSALDSENEHAVQEALARLMHGRTTLAIAHRLSTIQDANRIVLLEDGRIQAIGTHAELLANSPLYARLAKLQFKGE